MIDTKPLGLTTAQAMEYLDSSEEMDGGDLVACMVVVIVADKARETSFTRTFSSETMYYEQIGLLRAAEECIRDGYKFRPPAEADDDE